MSMLTQGLDEVHQKYTCMHEQKHDVLLLEPELSVEPPANKDTQTLAACQKCELLQKVESRVHILQKKSHLCSRTHEKLMNLFSWNDTNTVVR